MFTQADLERWLADDEFLYVLALRPTCHWDREGVRAWARDRWREYGPDEFVWRFVKGMSNMSRLSKEDQAKLIRIGETSQPKVLPQATVGDINSDAKGSGARYNAGKPPFDLVPIQMVADYFIHPHTGGYCGTTDVHRTLEALGRFQARRGEDHDSLLDCLIDLGVGGWEECARVFEYGRAKYAAWNWAKGMAWSVPIACAARHLLAMLRGEEIDPESGLPHRGHVFCNIVMLYTFGGTYPEGDDRPAKGLL